MRKKYFAFFVFILGFGVGIFAQNPYIRHYTTLDGLTSNTNYQIYQDSDKFIWFTSDAGVVKFDGSTFTSYRKKDGLSSNDIVRIKEDEKGRIWFFGYNGLVNYYYKNKIYNNKNAPFLSSLSGKGFILDFYTDSDQTIYFYNWQGDIFSLDTSNTVINKQLLEHIYAVRQMSGSKIKYREKLSYLSKSNADDWIIWHSLGIFRQNNMLNWEISIIDTSFHSETVFPVRNNMYYVKTYNNELIKVSDNSIREKVKFPYEVSKIKTVIEDSQGYLWIAAYDEGVYCMKNNRLVKHFDIKNALGLLQDHEQNIWVSTQSGGIYAINHDILEQNHYERYNFGNLGINLICEYPGLGIWCTNTKATYLLKNNNLYTLEVPAIVQPINIMHMFKDQTFMLGSISRLLCTFENLKPESSSKKITYNKSRIHFVSTKKIITDRTGNISALFDQNKIQFTNSFNPSFGSQNYRLNERINNAYYNSDNELIINAKNNYLYKNNKLEPYSELARFDGTVISDHIFLDDSTELFNIDEDNLYVLRKNKFYNFTDAFDTPVEMQIKKMLYVDSVLYLATLKDLYICRNPTKLLSGQALHLEPLNIRFNNINDILILNDTLYIASGDGLTVIANSSVKKSKASAPIPYLKSITVNDIIVSSSDQELELRGKNNIHLSFGCISYTSGSIIYSYMLEGNDKNWTIETGSVINLVYQNLPKGKYIFKLRVKKSNSGWSKPLELPVIIKPTLVEYPAFWAVIVVLGLGLIVLIVFLIRVEKMKRIEVDHQLIVLEQKALQSMMNPHFIFNSLGSIQNYLLKQKGAEAVIYLSEFAHLIRQNLNAINTPMILLEEEVERLKNYLDLEKKRLGNTFNYRIELEDELTEDGIYIPSMIIQPIAENAIWHGIASLEKMGEITISFHAYSATSLFIFVNDNGVGMQKTNEYTPDESHHKRLGMQIIEKRLLLLSKKYKTETGIKYSESNIGMTPPGTKVELILPFIYNNEGF